MLTSDLDRHITECLVEEAQMDFEAPGCKHRPSLITWECKVCGARVEMTEDEKAEFAVLLSREARRPLCVRLDGVRGTVFPSGKFVASRKRKG